MQRKSIWQFLKTTISEWVEAEPFQLAAALSYYTLFSLAPLLLGALGIAVGAAIGAALPATEQEDRLLGSMRDRTISEVKQRGAESYNQLREKVSAVGEEAKQSISNSVRESA